MIQHRDRVRWTERWLYDARYNDRYEFGMAQGRSHNCMYGVSIGSHGVGHESGRSSGSRRTNHAPTPVGRSVSSSGWDYTAGGSSDGIRDF